MRCLDRDCLAETVRDLSEPYTVYRTQLGQYDDHGRWIEPERKELCIPLYIQLATDAKNALKDIVQGRIVQHAIYIYSTRLMYDSRSNHSPDTVIYNDEPYEVHTVLNRLKDGGYCKSLGVLKSNVN